MRFVTCGTAILLAGSAPLAAQASPYVPLDDPGLPFVEHLIARGDVTDPSPFVRPFRRADIRQALARADSAQAGDTALIARLLDRYGDACAGAQACGPTWRIEPRLGVQAYTHARRDPLHPAGPDGAQPYGELGLEAVFGSFALVSRPVVEPRLIDDPDWPGRKDIEVAARQADAYISAQFRWARLLYGQLDRNWGPVGLPGIPLSNYGYGRPELGFEVGTGAVRFQALASDLRDERDSANALVHRYFFAHRLGARLSRRFYLAFWETVVFAGVDRTYQARLRNPLSLSFLENAYGLGQETNSMLGADIEWKLGQVTLQSQLALDDLTYKDRGAPDRNPDRWALTVMGFGPLGRRNSWRAFYTQASSLAFRTFDSQFQDFTDGGVGIGRNFADDDQLTLQVTLPVARRWLLSPELSMLRQGEGDINAPYPSGGGLGSTPQLFIGTVERTYRAAVRVNGSLPHFRISADLGYHRIMNHNHVEGQTLSRFEGRLFVTAGLVKRGTVP
ncbi:MAG: hypothetical protein ABI836_06165 [Gemmatimonadota bacterium]